jgi:hypothetical protein
MEFPKVYWRNIDFRIGHCVVYDKITKSSTTIIYYGKSIFEFREHCEEMDDH